MAGTCDAPSTTVISKNGDAENTLWVRFSSVLLPGKLSLILFPLAIASDSRFCGIRRLGDRSRCAALAGSA